MKSRRRVFLLAGITAGVDFAAIRSGASAATELPPLKETTNANIAIGVVVSHLSVLAAAEQGYFKKHNLNVNVSMFHAGNEINEALVAGKADVAATGLLPAVLAYAQAGGLSALSVYGYGGDRYSLIARKGAGISSIADLPGKRVASALGTDIELSIVLALQMSHIDPKQVQFVNMTFPDMIGAAARGELDAYVENEPQGSQMLTTLPDKVQLVTRLGRYYDAPGFFIGRNQWIEQQPLAMRHLVVALWEGMKYAREHPREAAEMMSRATKNLMSVQVSLDGIKLTTFDPRIRPQVSRELEGAANLAVAEGKVTTKPDLNPFTRPAYDLLHELEGPYGNLLPR